VYVVVALRDDPPSDWMSPAILQKLAAMAVKVTIAEGDKKAQELRVTEMR
jgi:hypothetical protein